MNRVDINFNCADAKVLLSRFLVQKFLTERLIRFIAEEGIFELFASMKHFTIRDAVAAFQQKLGYRLNNKTRMRMARIIIDLLYECGYLKKKGGLYLWDTGKGMETGLSDNDKEMVRITFKGQVDFFENCILYAHEFLAGKPPLYGFNDKFIHIWEEFLGDTEFRFGRYILINLLLHGRNGNLKALDLCYGPGFNILQLLEQSPDISVTALDFKDIFRSQAADRISNAGTVEWVNGMWKGFGNPLPFPDNSLDVIIFTCTDSYIPKELREYVYRDISRTLRHGGTIGILTHCYPDSEKIYVKDTWVRRGILCHDFSESVCEGWSGFYGAEESINLFNAIGYNIHTLMLNSSVWRLDKP
ncbi:MAG: class I SAM-dependent methyltransferase [Nitrospirae bacterium]|nr:class I SAM-dependent methyltransferase [Nitrospirota bacterium]